ncbi:hypothetical protein [Actinoplanes sp. NPDC049265]|uniref:hypothetical protein n=1 Tax=Actinoplanes sp. NPDC049265 TaxID=3363902 RepID=UPI00371FD840
MVQSSPRGAGRHGGKEQDHPPSLVTLVNKPDAFEFYLDAAPGYASADIAEALSSANAQGLEAMDPDEVDPELFDDGSVRIWLTTTDSYSGPKNPLLS